MDSSDPDGIDEFLQLEQEALQTDTVIAPGTGVAGNLSKLIQRKADSLKSVPLPRPGPPPGHPSMEEAGPVRSGDEMIRKADFYSLDCDSPNDSYENVCVSSDTVKHIPQTSGRAHSEEARKAAPGTNSPYAEPEPAPRTEGPGPASDDPSSRDPSTGLDGGLGNRKGQRSNFLDELELELGDADIAPDPAFLAAADRQPRRPAAAPLSEGGGIDVLAAAGNRCVPDDGDDDYFAAVRRNTARHEQQASGPGAPGAEQADASSGAAGQNVVRLPSFLKTRVSPDAPPPGGQPLAPGQRLDQPPQEPPGGAAAAPAEARAGSPAGSPAGEGAIDRQLRLMEAEIGKVTAMQDELEGQRAALERDHAARAQRLDGDRREFEAFRRDELARLKRERQLLEDRRTGARDAQREAAAKLRAAEASLEQLRQELRTLQDEKRRREASSRLALEQLRAKTDATLAENRELRAKLEAQDKAVVDLRGRLAALERQNRALDRRVRSFASIGALESASRSIGEDAPVAGAVADAAAGAGAGAAQRRGNHAAGHASGHASGAGAGPGTGAAQRATGARSGSQQIYSTLKNEIIAKVKESFSPRTPESAGRARAAGAAGAAVAPSAPSAETSEQQAPGPGEGVAGLVPYSVPEEFYTQFNKDVLTFVAGARIVEEAEGKDSVKKTLSTGSRLVEYANSRTKLVLPDGCINVKLENGDLNQILPDGRNVYLFAEVGTMCTTVPCRMYGSQAYRGDKDAVKVYRFGNGQVEHHLPDGQKEVFYPDGVVKYVDAAGRERTVRPGGR